MEFSKLLERATEPVLSAKERQESSILIVESEQTLRAALRQTLIALDFGYIADANDHSTALRKIEERFFSHVIFETQKKTMTAREFLQKTLEYDARIIAIPSSYEPTVDDVFDLLIAGARGYIVKPFTSGAVDESMVMATKGDPISESILYAKSRNEALVSLMLSSLDKYATLLRQASQFETARRELPRRELAFRRAADIARTFAQGGEEALLQTLLELAIERSEEPATRLGRVRKYLEKSKRSKPSPGEEDVDGDRQPLGVDT